MDKPTKPTNLMPRSFGGVKNNFSASMQSTGFEDGIPVIYGGDNLNYQLDATGKELDYCEKICDFINALPIGKGITVDANNKLVYANYETDITGKANISLDNLNANGKARIAVKEYLVTETYIQGDVVLAIIDDEVKLFKSLIDNNTGNALSDDTKWEEVKLGGGARNIGEIVSSIIPLVDDGLHLLDGALLQYGSYQAFIDYIADLYDSGDYTEIFETEANWQTSVTNYGVCGKFVYDSTNNTVRLPKITGFVEGASDIINLGNLTLAGLPNLLGNVALSQGGITNIDGVFSSTSTSTGTLQNGGMGYIQNINFDASRSSSIYGNSSTVQPQSIKVLYYIVIATSTKTDIQVDIDEIATDLNGKADVDLSNVPTSKGILTESYVNGTSWYRVYSDGWCEQGGDTNGVTNIAFLKNYANTNYIITSGLSGTGSSGEFPAFNRTISGFTVSHTYVTSNNFMWQACGYIR